MVETTITYLLYIIAVGLGIFVLCGIGALCVCAYQEIRNYLKKRKEKNNINNDLSNRLLVNNI